MNKHYELIGRINNKKLVKVYEGERKGQTYYKLFPLISNKEEVRQLFVYQDTVKEEIWKTVEEGDFYCKDYKFICQIYKRIPGNYKLIDWKELKDHGSN